MDAMQAKAQRRYENRYINYLALGLILYTLISLAVVLLDLLIRVLSVRVSVAVGADAASFRRWLDAFYDNEWTTIVGVLCGIVFLYLFTRKRMPLRAVFFVKRRMTPTVFFEAFCVFSAGQLLFTLFDKLLEYCLNLIGFSAATSVEMATQSSDDLSMFLYACVVAPIVEELIFRGFCLRFSQQFGRVFAIVFSAALFGIMHANLPQAVFAFYVGLVFGYVTIEYSIGYAILLHFINNCVFGEALDLLLDGFPERVQTVSYYLLFGALAVAGLIVLVANRKAIAAYLKENPATYHAYRYAFSAVGVLMFIAINLIPALMLLDRI